MVQLLTNVFTDDPKIGHKPTEQFAFALLQIGASLPVTICTAERFFLS